MVPRLYLLPACTKGLQLQGNLRQLTSELMGWCELAFTTGVRLLSSTLLPSILGTVRYAAERSARTGRVLHRARSPRARRTRGSPTLCDLAASWPHCTP